MAPNPRHKLTKRDRLVAMRGMIKARLAAGWVPFVRPDPSKLTGSQEVWAKIDEETGDVTIARPITPPEGELVSQIMEEERRHADEAWRNSYMWRDGT